MSDFNVRAALPFFLKRSNDEFSGTGMTSTRETVHGLLRLEESKLVIQWRAARRIDVLDSEMRTEREFDAVQHIEIPLSGLAGATVRQRWWHWFTGPRIVLSASHLAAFEAIAGEAGLGLDHPAVLVLRLRRADRLVAEEFSAELALAIAERTLPEGARIPRLRDATDPLRDTPDTNGGGKDEA